MRDLQIIEIDKFFRSEFEKPVENPYGETIDPAQVPEMISRTVSSLLPEQMFELMQQMKQCIQNNSNEARQMLLQNPQLAYALLQTLVVIRVIDPNHALTMLQKGPGSMGMPEGPMGGGMPFGGPKPFPIPSNEPWVGQGGARPGPIGQDMDLRHGDLIMGRGDHNLRVMPGPGPAPQMAVGDMGMNMPPAIRPAQPVPEWTHAEILDLLQSPVGPRDPRAGMSRQPAPNVAPTMQGPPASSSLLLLQPDGGRWPIGAGTRH